MSDDGRAVLATRQFGLRALLAGTTIVAVLLAVFVPLLDKLEPETRRQSWVVIAALSAVSLVSFLTIVYLRWRMESRGGPLLRRCQPMSRWMERALNLFMIGILLAILAGTTYVALPIALGAESAFAMLEQPWLGTSLLIVVLAPPLIGLVYTVTLVWWRESFLSLELRQNGLGFAGIRYAPWQSVTSCSWKDRPNGCVLTLTVGSLQRIAAISLPDKEPVQAILRSKGIAGTERTPPSA